MAPSLLIDPTFDHVQVCSNSSFGPPQRFPLLRAPFERYHVGSSTSVPEVPIYQKLGHDWLKGHGVYIL